MEFAANALQPIAPFCGVAIEPVSFIACRLLFQRTVSSSCKIFLQNVLDISLKSDILKLVDNYVWNAGANSRFSFFGASISAFANPKQRKLRPLESSDYEMQICKPFLLITIQIAGGRGPDASNVESVPRATALEPLCHRDRSRHANSKRLR